MSRTSKALFTATAQDIGREVMFPDVALAMEQELAELRAEIAGGAHDSANYANAPRVEARAATQRDLLQAYAGWWITEGTQQAHRFATSHREFGSAVWTGAVAQCWRALREHEALVVPHADADRLIAQLLEIEAKPGDLWEREVARSAREEIQRLRAAAIKVLDAEKRYSYAQPTVMALRELERAVGREESEEGSAK